MEDAIIIGAGPAGATCALWLHQLGLRVLLLDANACAGGLQLCSPHPNRWIPGGHRTFRTAGRRRAAGAAAKRRRAAPAAVSGRRHRRVDVYCRSVPRAQALLQAAIDPRRVHVGPFEADQAAMTVNGLSHDVLGVQFGFDACVPPGLALPLRGGRIEVDRRGAVASVPGLYAAGEVTDFWHPCVTTACAQGVQVAKAIQLERQYGASRRRQQRAEAQGAMHCASAMP